MSAAADLGLRGLVVDWGGVLTTDLRSAMIAWATDEQVDITHFSEVMRAWFGAEGELEAAVNPVMALERGEMEVPDFERRLAGEMSRRAGLDVRAEGLLSRLFTYFEHADDMTGLVRRARNAGIRTALLSNSWGNAYPEHLFDGLFDVVVISGQVGMRKPEERIFRHTLRELRLDAGECVFIDDLDHNTQAAADLGFVAIQHRSYERTHAELIALFPGADL